jgi:hypothetical protein
MDESRALQRAGWAGAASVVLLAVGWRWATWSASTTPSMSDAAILERLNDDARQVAARVGTPVLAAGVALLLRFATGRGGSWTGCPAATRSYTRSCRRPRCSAG